MSHRSAPAGAESLSFAQAVEHRPLGRPRRRPRANPASEACEALVYRAPRCWRISHPRRRDLISACMRTGSRGADARSNRVQIPQYVNSRAQCRDALADRPGEVEIGGPVGAETSGLPVRASCRDHEYATCSSCAAAEKAGPSACYLAAPDFVKSVHTELAMFLASSGGTALPT